MQGKTHFCLGAGSHEDGCDCDCGVCISRNEDLKREAFNKRLSERIAELTGYLQRDTEFRTMVAEELLKK